MRWSQGAGAFYLPHRFAFAVDKFFDNTHEIRLYIEGM